MNNRINLLDILEASLDKAISKAIEFLIISRSSDKLWHDFSLLPGVSDEWISGYVASVLSETGNGLVEDVVKETWNTLGWRRFTGHGGWGYNSNSFEDADSTLWCLRLANSLGVGNLLRAEMATGFILRHISGDGGLCTYARENLSGGSNQTDYSGWLMNHSCVTSAAANLVQFNHLLTPYLVDNQQADGSWKGYWWIDDTYTTAFAVEALIKSERGEYEKSCELALKWVLEQFGGGDCICNERLAMGSPFSTALGLRIISLADKEGRAGGIRDSIIQWLISGQVADGSWESSAFMRVPPKDLMDPESYEYIDWSDGMKENWGVITKDQNRLFTSATVLHTLLLL